MAWFASTIHAHLRPYARPEDYCDLPGSADVYFFWCFRRAISFKLDLSAFPNCMAFFERMQQPPSVLKVWAHEKQVDADFARAA